MGADRELGSKGSAYSSVGQNAQPYNRGYEHPALISTPGVQGARWRALLGGRDFGLLSKNGAWGGWSVFWKGIVVIPVPSW